MKTNPNDPISWDHFSPKSTDKNGVVDGVLPGLTKREYFAAMAMQGFISTYRSIDPKPDHVAEKATEYADALIEALNK